MPLLETIGSGSSKSFGLQGKVTGATNGPIVTSGLYIYMDPANTSSYNGSGGTVYDLSGNGRNGSMTNMSSSNWVLLNGFRAFNTFKLNNENVQIPYSSSSLNNRTYSVWVNTKGFGGQNGNASGWHTWLDDGSTESVLFGSPNDTVGVYNSVYSSGITRSANVWYHIVYTVSGGSNGAGGTVKIYVNGVEIPGYAGGATTYAQLNQSQTTLYWMGDSGTETSFAYFGSMMIYNRALSASEIQQNFRAHSGRYGY